jgi:hypothetical protein
MKFQFRCKKIEHHAQISIDEMLLGTDIAYKELRSVCGGLLGRRLGRLYAGGRVSIFTSPRDIPS